MVTARMSVAKKEAGVRALRSLGMTASEAINAMFDHLLSNGSLPFSAPESQSSREERMAQSIRRVDAIHKVEVSPDIQRMSIKDARRARLRGRGLADDASLAE
jgi:antitoxin component of RelBE/YafQ-DinJ toxin-antitoxin module